MKVIKMSVNLSEEIVAELRRLSEKRGTTMTEVLRQAIGSEKYFDDVRSVGGKVLVEDQRGQVREVVFR